MLATNSPDPTFRYGQEEASGRAMNTVDAGASIVGPYTYMPSYTYVMLYYTYTVYVYYIYIGTKTFVRAKQSA